MSMGKPPKNHLLSKPLLPLVGLVFPSLYYKLFFARFGFSTNLFVSFAIMILSTLFLLKFTKKTPTSDEKNPLSNQSIPTQPHKEIEISHEKHAKNELVTVSERVYEEHKTAQQSENAMEDSEVLELEDFPSESEVSSEQSDDFELKWDMQSTNVGQNLPLYGSCFSEEDDDEEENPIEIILFGGDSSMYKEDSKLNLPEFLPETTCSQESFVGHLEDMSEFDEEDNLIEIDISMGSIKCPRFEIKA